MKNLYAGLATSLFLSVAPSMPAPAADDFSGVHDFDFEHGSWNVHHRIKRPTGEWYEMEGTSQTRPMLGGQGNVEDNLFHRPTGDTRGVAIRAYDPATATWAIWWIDSRFPHNPLDPPMIGKFVNGVGTFYSDSEINGKMTRTRFIWTHKGKTAHWEQAFSTDSGKTWDTNWIMEFRRAQSE